MSLKKKFYQSDESFDNKLENNLTRKLKRKKVKINLTLINFRHKRNIQK